MAKNLINRFIATLNLYQQNFKFNSDKIHIFLIIEFL